MSLIHFFFFFKEANIYDFTITTTVKGHALTFHPEVEDFMRSPFNFSMFCLWRWLFSSECWCLWRPVSAYLHVLSCVFAAQVSKILCSRWAKESTQNTCHLSHKTSLKKEKKKSSFRVGIGKMIVLLLACFKCTGQWNVQWMALKSCSVLSKTDVNLATFYYDVCCRSCCSS